MVLWIDGAAVWIGKVLAFRRTLEVMPSKVFNGNNLTRSKVSATNARLCASETLLPCGFRQRHRAHRTSFIQIEPSRLTVTSPNEAPTFTLSTAGSENMEAAQARISLRVEGRPPTLWTRADLVLGIGVITS